MPALRSYTLDYAGLKITISAGKERGVRMNVQPGTFAPWNSGKGHEWLFLLCVLCRVRKTSEGLGMVHKERLKKCDKKNLFRNKKRGDENEKLLILDYSSMFAVMEIKNGTATKL